MSRIDFTVLLYFDFLKKLHLPIRQFKNKIQYPDSKIHWPRTIGHDVLCTLPSWFWIKLKDIHAHFEPWHSLPLAYKLLNHLAHVERIHLINFLSMHGCQLFFPCSYITMLPGVENLSGIRTFRVLRALRTISAVKGKNKMKTKVVIVKDIFFSLSRLRTSNLAAKTERIPRNVCFLFFYPVSLSS